jgi:hypothetical protein
MNKWNKSKGGKKTHSAGQAPCDNGLVYSVNASCPHIFLLVGLAAFFTNQIAVASLPA